MKSVDSIIRSKGHVMYALYPGKSREVPLGIFISRWKAEMMGDKMWNYRWPIRERIERIWVQRTSNTVYEISSHQYRTIKTN